MQAVCEEIQSDAYINNVDHTLKGFSFTMHG